VVPDDTDPVAAAPEDAEADPLATCCSATLRRTAAVSVISAATALTSAGLCCRCQSCTNAFASGPNHCDTADSTSWSTSAVANSNVVVRASSRVATSATRSTSIPSIVMRRR